MKAFAHPARGRYGHQLSGLGNTVFTTGQVARLCTVAPRTVSKWCDSGKLVAYRLPGSNDRRIEKEDLIKFLHTYKMIHKLRQLVPDGPSGTRTVVTACSGDVESVSLARAVMTVVNLNGLVRMIFGSAEGCAYAAEAAGMLKERFPKLAMAYIMGEDGKAPPEGLFFKVYGNNNTVDDVFDDLNKKGIV